MPSSASRDARFDVYGLGIRVGGTWPEVQELVRQDWAWFERAERPAPQLQVRIDQTAPDLSRFGPLEASFVTPRNVVYHDAARTIVDYFGRALVLLEPQSAVVQGVDGDLVREAVWHLLLARVGAHLDRIGRPRLHALGLSGAQGAVAVLLPGGGGKSRLTLSALRDDVARISSDDMPLFDRDGLLHPFPIRLSVNPSDAHELGPRAQRVERMEFHPRFVLPIEAFRDRVEPHARPLAGTTTGSRLGRFPFAWTRNGGAGSARSTADW